ncbi:MAG: phospho-sugar mutase [Candidatus Cyclobacteriaceae bacterium M3_2C_046]
MDNLIKEKAEKWLSSNIDQESRQKIETLLSDSDSTELVDAFYKDLEFGTGGLRGIMGVGSNRINKYTIGMATQGLSNYLKRVYPKQEVKVAIAHDSRNNSQFFAETTATVFSANGIKVYFFESLRPTPELSFAIRHLKCHSGVVLTASHNPKEYNGYKAYWNDGGQLIPPHDKNVIEEVAKIKDINEVKFEKNKSLIETIGENIDEAYLKKALSLSEARQAISNQKDLRIIYTPIHGSGVTLLPKVLSRMGFTNVTVLAEQAEPDGNFPTVVYPNPEEPAALDLALKKAEEIQADLILGTDPDADRVGIAVRNHHGKFQLLNGNQTGSLLIYYMLKKWQENGKLDGQQYVVKTIVTTDIIEKIAQFFEVDCYNTLTGFKYIAEIIKNLENQKTFIAGGEESYGYLVGDFVRDKDAIISSAMIAEMVAYAKDNGQSLFDMLLEMYQKFGFYKESLISITKKGKEGEEAIQKMMLDLRNDPPAKINGAKLVKMIDYQKQVSKDFNTGKEALVELPKSNVLQFFTEDGSKISARPSGTEPKIKFYFSVNEPLEHNNDFDKVSEKLDQKIKDIIADLHLK